MKTPVAILFGLVALVTGGVAEAESLEDIIGDRAAVGLPADLAVTAVHLPASLATADVDATAVDIDFPSAARPGRASVKVRLLGKRARTVFVPVTIARVVEVAIATRDLAPGEIVSSGDVRWEHRPSTAPRATVGGSPVGQVVTADVSSGDILDDARLSAPPPVARGSEVRVEVRRGAVAIHARGKLEQAARLGAPARVRLSTGSIVSGRLADADRVIVEAP
jgi:flagella basal body P-ring formation protein FlgA